MAEIGSNWEGDIYRAERLIMECKEAGSDAVKFQMWRQKDLYPDNPEFKKYELTFEKASRLKGFCDGAGIEFFCSVFYPEAVAFLEKLGVKRYKIASRTCTKKDPHWAAVIEAIDETRKPVIISNGMGGYWLEIQEWFELQPTKELYCISDYPTRPQDIDWDEIFTYDGFSDHTLGIESALRYALLKPDGIIEKHVKLKDSKSPDAFFSITTQELATLMTRLTSSSDIPG